MNAAAARWGIPAHQWLDLSTGINPWPWPVPHVPAAVWQRLPEDDDGLEEAVRSWLSLPDAAGVLPVAGSQAAIQQLPRLRAPANVIVPAPGYAEHGYRWRQAGHRVRAVASDALDAAVDHADVVVWIQPNNPDGTVMPPGVLLDWHARLARRQGWLVVDEAFVDAVPGQSIVSAVGAPGLVVMRSLGKFFGLAGARGGLVLGPQQLCERLDAALGPWALSGPARWVMCRAIADHDWQRANRDRLQRASDRLAALLRGTALSPTGGTALFSYCLHPRAELIRDGLARQGILVRLFDQPSALRIGLPPDAASEQRLRRALATVV
nr:threonine-phosphate decarboxylase CobD [Natronocella acetinitrilica]